jgi:hypothetical protein
MAYPPPQAVGLWPLMFWKRNETGSTKIALTAYDLSTVSISNQPLADELILLMGYAVQQLLQEAYSGAENSTLSDCEM